jgi:hypothetical protein
VSDSHAPLSATLLRVDHLINSQDLDRERTREAHTLSHATGLPVRRIQPLLAGGNATADAVDSLLRKRINSLHETRLDHTRRPYDPKTVTATTAATTSVRIHRTPAEDRNPNTAHTHAPIRCLRVDEPDFLTAQPADTPNRALRPTPHRLDRTSTPR